MQLPEPINTKSKLEHWVEKTNLFEAHLYLEGLLKSLFDTHLKRYPKSRIESTASIFNRFIVKLKTVDLDEYEGRDLYLVWLTSIADELQSLRCYHAEELVLLGKLLTHKINGYVKDHPNSQYFNCEIQRESVFLYSIRNSLNKLWAQDLLQLYLAPYWMV